MTRTELNIDIQESTGEATAEAESGKEESELDRIYIELDYLGNIPNADLSKFYEKHPQLDKAAEFTWWEKYSGKGYATVIFRDYNVILPYIDTIDCDVVISFGRKLKELYYENVPVQSNFYYARPVFE